MAKKKTEPKAKKHHRVQRNKKKLAKKIAKLFAKKKKNTKPIPNKETPAENTKNIAKTNKHKTPCNKKTQKPLQKKTWQKITNTLKQTNTISIVKKQPP